MTIAEGAQLDAKVLSLFLTQRHGVLLASLKVSESATPTPAKRGRAKRGRSDFSMRIFPFAETPFFFLFTAV